MRSPARDASTGVSKRARTLAQRKDKLAELFSAINEDHGLDGSTASDSDEGQLERLEKLPCVSQS